MKEMLKKRMVMPVLLICAALLAGCAGSYGTWDEQWYSQHPMTKAEVMAHWGAPDQVLSHEDGVQEMVYKRKIPPSDAQSAFVYKVKDDKVIDQYWKEL